MKTMNNLITTLDNVDNVHNTYRNNFDIHEIYYTDLFKSLNKVLCPNVCYQLVLGLINTHNDNSQFSKQNLCLDCNMSWAFSWENTKQGWDFWNKLYLHLAAFEDS